MQNRKWLRILLALLASVALWVYVVTIENPEGERTFSNIPVMFVGEDLLREDHELLITNDNVPTGISLTFKGKLSDLSKLAENKDELIVNIDVSKLRNAREYPFAFDIYDVTLPASLSAQNLALESSYPNKVNIVVEKLKKKPIPVKVLTEVDIIEGYTADRLIQNYSEIVIEGPEDVVNEVSYAQAILNRENVDQTIISNLSYQLMDGNGEMVESKEITSDVTEIEVTLPILMYKDVNLEVPLIDGGGATGADAVVDIEPSKIRLSADPAVLEAIQSIKLSAVDLASLMTNSEEVTRMITTPDGCINLSGEQEAVVSIQIKNKSIRQMRISSNHYSYIGVPDGFRAEARTSVLPITIRANTSDIDLILEDNVRVVVDLTNASLSETTTSTTVPVKIYIDGFEGVGVIGETEYSVVVDISPITEENE